MHGPMHGPMPGPMRARRRGAMEETPPAIDRRLLRRVWAFARPYRFKLSVFVVLVTFSSLIALIPPLLFRSIVDEAIPNGDRNQVFTLGLFALLIAVVSTLEGLIERWLSSSIGEGLIFDLRTALFDHVQRMPIAFFTRTQTGALNSRMTGDVIGAQRAITGTGAQLLSQVLTLVTTVLAMLALDWQLTLLALGLFPLFFIPTVPLGRVQQDIARESMQLNAAMSVTMTERFNVAGAMLVKLFGKREQEVDEFRGRARRVRDIGVRSAVVGRVYMSVLSLLASLGLVAVYWFGATRVISGGITIGTLVALAAYVGRIYGPLTSLATAHVDVLVAFVSFDRVFELLDTPVLVDDRPDALELGRPRGRVELDHVEFHYPPASEVSIASLEGDGTSTAPLDARAGVPVLKDIDAVLEPGALVALVGPSGAGKTTLASLVPRLYDVTGGAIRIDGVDVRDVTQRSLRAAMGVVTQDSHLFHDTVRNNLLYARADASDAELFAVCRAARIHDVIDDLPDGYDTLVGERGYRLSGGEKQRLAIARMMLKDPSIVILDEATSHLDAENELQVQLALATALEGRTSLVIAHRLSTIQAADLILVLDEGEIVERGTHAELLDHAGLYADLYHTLVREAV